MKNIIFFIGLLILISSDCVQGQTLCTDTVIYNSGTVPLLVSAGYIYAGSSAGSGGSGIVAVQPGETTSFAAVHSIFLQPGFKAIVTGAGSFSAGVVACSSARVESGQGNAPVASVPGLSAAFRIYPTVSAGRFMVTGSLNDLQNTDIIVCDELGQVVFTSHHAAETAISLDLGNLGNGLYFLQLRKGSRQIVRKIIVSK